MIVSVVISSATLVPCLSFALSTFDRQPTTYLGPEEAFTMTIRWKLAVAAIPGWRMEIVAHIALRLVV